MTGSAHHPYRWEIIDDDSGQVVQKSDEQYRKPRQAWEASSAAIKRLFRRLPRTDKASCPARTLLGAATLPNRMETDEPLPYLQRKLTGAKYPPSHLVQRDLDRTDQVRDD